MNEPVGSGATARGRRRAAEATWAPPGELAPRFIATAVVLGLHGLLAVWLIFGYVPYFENAGRSPEQPLVLKGALACHAVLLFVHAIGLLLQRPFAWGFALGFLGLNAIGSLGGGGLALHGVVRDCGPDWDQFACYVLLGGVALLILQGMVCGLMAVLLYRGRDQLESPVGGTAWAGGVFGAAVLASVCIIVWRFFP